jgi:hypothetical protein
MVEMSAFLLVPSLDAHCSPRSSPRRVASGSGTGPSRRRALARFVRSPSARVQFIQIACQNNNALLWTETVSTLNEWFQEWDAAIAASPQSNVTVGITNVMRHVTLFVIASAGFGMHFSRKHMGFHKPGFTMSFGEALFKAVESVIPKAMLPSWVYKLPIKNLQDIEMAYIELKRYIIEMIEEARAGKHVNDAQDQDAAADLFRRLLAANEDETDPKAQLSDNETASNIYVNYSDS